MDLDNCKQAENEIPTNLKIVQNDIEMEEATSGNTKEKIVTSEVPVGDLVKRFENVESNPISGELKPNLEQDQEEIINSAENSKEILTSKPKLDIDETENKDEDDAIYYISEDEEPPLPEFHTKTDLRTFSNTEKQPQSSSVLSYKTYASIASSTPGPSPQYQKHKESKLSDLSGIGTFAKIDATSDIHKIIHKYAINSINLNTSSNTKLKVHCIYKLEPKRSKTTLSGVVDKALNKLSGKSKEMSMLLWCKTTPDSIKNLSRSKDSCMAFYDRLCRALPFPINDLKTSSRQMVLLCKVKLGNMEKSPHGYSRWQNKYDSPLGTDSVKGVGKYRPNWKENKCIQDAIVPCGPTEIDTRSPHFELEFNEYLVFQGSKIEVLFAVDIEICLKYLK